RACAREAIGGRGTGGTRAYDGDVEAFHEAKATIRRPPGVCPSGQRERAVNPSAQPTEVRILPPPFLRASSTRGTAPAGSTTFAKDSDSREEESEERAGDDGRLRSAIEDERICTGKERTGRDCIEDPAEDPSRRQESKGTR